MGTVAKDFVTAFILGLLLPFSLLGAAVSTGSNSAQESAPLPAETEESAQIRYEMVLMRDGQISSQDLDGYLVGVVLAEMPAAFSSEALKAQAVAARTYVRRAWETGGKHGNQSVCTESTCCQAYLSEEEYLAMGGSPEAVQKVRRAVEATSGLVLEYDGELIEATYFSCSGGNTEAAVAVWGTDYPYLRSVSSPGEEDSAYYRDTVTMTPEDFADKLGITAEGRPESWFGLSSYTAGGSVQSMEIGDKTFTGTQMRSIFGLRSAAFTVDVVKGEIQITTKGYGHRVGMSQYGAEAMARKGHSFSEILSHYYPGTNLRKLQP